MKNQLIKLNSDNNEIAKNDEHKETLVYALEKLKLVTSPAQLKRLSAQNQNAGTLGLKVRDLQKQKMDLQRKLHQTPEFIQLKELKKELKYLARALDSAIDMLNGSYETLLADFMPGASIPEKIKTIESAISQKQLPKSIQESLNSHKILKEEK